MKGIRRKVVCRGDQIEWQIDGWADGCQKIAMINLDIDYQIIYQLDRMNKNYLHQVALIESQCEPRNKIPNIPAVVFNRSPLRDRQNKINLANQIPHNNTPNRVGKVSLSPLRSRRCDTSASVKSTLRKKLDIDCTNHPSKLARYLVESQEQSLFYCEKCAILLASQGFKVSKINDQPQTNHHRKKEIQQFMNELESLSNNLNKRHGMVEALIATAHQHHQNQITKIEDYYSQFYQVIDEHKRRVLEELKIEYDGSKIEVQLLKKSYQEAISQSNSMKEDINASINSIIMEAEEAQYRPVMDLYKDKVKKFKTAISTHPDNTTIKLRNLSFKDGDELCQLIADGLAIEWQDEKAIQESLQSDGRAINPVECLESQEKFAKSSLKQLGGLFCSFDE